MDHLHDHDHAHTPDGHGHDHAHAHGDGEYYLEQLLTILVCGALGTVAIVMYMNATLEFLLAPEFHVWVLAGGIMLLLLTAIRGAALWVAVGPSPTVADAHAHAHGPDCDHSHNHAHGHHGHDHAPGAMYLKVIPFALPVLMCVMGLPNKTFSQEWVSKRLGIAENIVVKDVAESANKDVIGFDFNELNAAAYDESKRAEFEGRRIRVKGQLKKVSPKDYQLFKLKMTCCAADVIPLKARIRSEIVIPESEFKDYDWVVVEGTLQFVELPEKRQFLPVIRIGGDRGLGLTKATPE